MGKQNKNCRKMNLKFDALRLLLTDEPAEPGWHCFWRICPALKCSVALSVGSARFVSL